MENIVYDFNKICRVCKAETPIMKYVFVEDGVSDDGPRIDEMLMACTGIIVNYGDGLPNLICQNCNQQLLNSFHFKQLCENTDGVLRGYLEAAKISENIKEEFFSNKVEYEINHKQEVGVNDDVDAEEDDCDGVNRVKPDPEEEEDLMRSTDYIQFLDNNRVILTCRNCSKCFATVEGLKSHKRLHTGSLFKCKHCGKLYTRLYHLQRHELLHSSKKVLLCKICNKTLTRYEHLKRHLITHVREKPFTCEKCGKGLSRSEHLMNHVLRCKGDRVHICDICNKGFNRQDSLLMHKKIHENNTLLPPTIENLDNIDDYYIELECNELNETISTSESDPEQDENNCNDEPNTPTECNPVKLGDLQYVENIETETELFQEIDSAELFENKTKIEEELLNNENEEEYMINERAGSDTDNSEYLPTKPSVPMKRKRGRPRKNFAPKLTGRPRGRPPLKPKWEDADSITDPEGEFACPSCNKLFKKISLLEKHADKHEGLKIHSCNACEKKFSRGTHLKRHLLCHLAEKLYPCDICSKRFNRRDHLMQHMKLHVKSQGFDCEVCKKSFSKDLHLIRHMASKHKIGEKLVSEKKYSCTVCLKNFTTEKYRDIHMKGHTGDKKFQCRTCDKSFLSKSHLTEHIKFHNENSKKFLCSECGQRFIRNDYLVIHMRRHRGEKPFKCQYCGKGFPRTTDLTVHERYHTGEKTHLCTICGRGFGRAYNLTVHMRTHTGEKPYRCTYCEAAFAQGNDLKAHVRRHTGERFHCELCSESFLMGYLLTQHKRNVHGLNIVSNIRRLQPIVKDCDDTPPPITVPLPPAVVTVTTFNTQIKEPVCPVGFGSLIKQDPDDLDEPLIITESLSQTPVATVFNSPMTTHLTMNHQIAQ
ncbi:hypothetical protein FQA39_LY08106 [Lamprigera yunnana]|nr:hypothetical protein FQA39_LY08106 [Lamprigera yunnana]